MSCSSLSLVHAFYNLAVKSKLKWEENDFLNRIYQKLTQKLVHFVLTKGWKELLHRIKESRTQSNDTLFSSDIYR